MSARLMRRYIPVLALLASACGGSSSSTPPPTGPSGSSSGGGLTAADPAIGGTSASLPNATAVIAITASPNPAPFSGAPITDATVCAGVANTWFYTQTLTETASVSVTITSIVDRIDGVIINNVTNRSDALRPRGALTYGYRWCFTDGNSRTVQSTFSGLDANGHAISVTGPAVTLQARSASSNPNAAITVSVTPNPAPFSGAPITDAAVCAGNTNTWFYTETLVENLGVNVTISSIVDRIDGVLINNITDARDVLRARGGLTYGYRWCFTIPTSRTVQSTFSGVDANGRAVIAVGPVVTLQARPGAGLAPTALTFGGGPQRR
jgi:hypothetical protein